MKSDKLLQMMTLLSPSVGSEDCTFEHEVNVWAEDNQASGAAHLRLRQAAPGYRHSIYV